MLDTVSYRAAESAAKAQHPSWRQLQIHRLDAFEAVGFPVRVASMSELGMLLDTMQEGRTEKYRREMGELSAADSTLLAQALSDHADFVRTYFPHRIAGALDTLTAMLAAYRKLRDAAPGFTRILEIGPGCGYLSFFLKRHPGLENYTQVEACESFYLLQYLVGLHSFGPNVDERAITQRAGTFSHFPWWQADALGCRKYDAVMANACLLEFSPGALAQYLTIAAKVLRPGGKFVAQCFGHTQNGGPADLARAFDTHGFRKISMMAPNEANKLATWNGIWERL